LGLDPWDTAELRGSRGKHLIFDKASAVSPPIYIRPELIGEGPIHVWSWDISKLMRPAKRTYFYLCRVTDMTRQPG